MSTYLQLAESKSVKKGNRSEHLEGDCWVWSGYVHSGRPAVVSHSDGKQRIKSLRVALLGELGDEPEDGVVVRIKCDESLCVNPSHLRWVCRDEWSLFQRESNGAKLTLRQLDEAWDRKQNGESVVSIAADLGISRQGLYRQWKRWR